MYSKINLILILFFISLLNGFSQDSTRVAKIDSCSQKILFLQTKIDSLEKKIKKGSLELTATEKKIKEKVYAMHSSWEVLSTVKEPKLLLDFFQRNFIVNRVTVNANNTAEVASYDRKTFKEFLKNEIITKEGIRYVFEDVSFLSLEVKNDIYFTTTYKCKLKVYVNDILTTNSSLLVTITGKKTEDKWGIASYSWTDFTYKN